MANNCLKTVVFNEKLQKIGEMAFECCYYMEMQQKIKHRRRQEKVVIPDGVSVIGQNAFLLVIL